MHGSSLSSSPVTQRYCGEKNPRHHGTEERKYAIVQVCGDTLRTGKTEEWPKGDGGGCTSDLAPGTRTDPHRQQAKRDDSECGNRWQRCAHRSGGDCKNRYLAANDQCNETGLNEPGTTSPEGRSDLRRQRPNILRQPCLVHRHACRHHAGHDQIQRTADTVFANSGAQTYVLLQAFCRVSPAPGPRNDLHLYGDAPCDNIVRRNHPECTQQAQRITGDDQPNQTSCADNNRNRHKFAQALIFRDSLPGMNALSLATARNSFDGNK